MPNSINPIKRVKAFGQSIWYDNIQRSMFSSGALDLLIKDGVMGITSNPTIFEKAINGSSDYDNTLISLLETDLTAEAIFEKLAVEDIQTAADFFKPIYQKTNRRDGFISLEVRPTLAYETKQTIDEALRLWELIDCPNVMIKVPATPEGIPAIETLTSMGVNVNVTLIFSISQYQAVAKAYVAGLEKKVVCWKSSFRNCFRCLLFLEPH